MRVVLVTHRFPPDGVAGVERYTQTLARELRGLGDEVSIFARRPEADPLPKTYEELLPDGTRVYRVIGGSVSLDQPLRDHERLERLFSAVLLQEAPDVVHFNHLWGLPPRLVEIALRHRAGVVISLHDYFFSCAMSHLVKTSGEACGGPDGGAECARTCFLHQGKTAGAIWTLRTAYLRRALWLAHSLITYSESLMTFHARFSGRGREAFSVIPHGIRRGAQLPAASTSKARITIGYFGTVSEAKGVHVILDAIRHTGLRDVELRVFGWAPNASYVDDLKASAAEIPGLFLSTHGAYEPEQLFRLANGLDVVIVPSLVPETSGLVHREALAAGIPVLVSSEGALGESVDPGVNGFVFNPHDTPQLANLIRRLVDEPATLEALTRGAKSTPIPSARDHASSVRAVYLDAHARASRGDGPSPEERADARGLHDLLERSIVASAGATREAG